MTPSGVMTAGVTVIVATDEVAEELLQATLAITRYLSPLFDGDITGVR